MATRTIETNIILGGEKEFNSSMKSINSNLKTMRSDMAAVAAEFGDSADSMEALTAKQKSLVSIQDQQAEKVRILRERYAEMSRVYGENSAQADKAKQELNQAIVAHSRAVAEVRKNEAALEALTNAERQNEDAVEDNTDAVEENADAHERASSMAEKLGTAAQVVAAGLAAVGAAGVAGLVAVTGFAREAAEAAKAAQEAGETLSDGQAKWLEFANNLESFDSSVASAKAALAGVLLPALTDLSTEGGALLESFSREMEAAAGNTGKQGEILGRYIAQGAQLIKSRIPEYAAAGKALFAGLAEGIDEEGPALMDMGVELMIDLLDNIIAFAPQLGTAGITLIGKLVESLGERGPELMISAVDMVTQIVSGLGQASPQMIPAAGNLVVQLISALISASPELLMAGIELVLGILAGIANSFGDIENSADAIVTALYNVIVDGAQKFIDAGSGVVANIKQGLSDGWKELTTWFNDLWDSLFSNRKADVLLNYQATGDIPGHATGLSYVPYDDYLAKLHKGEMILTRSQANLYRQGRSQGVTVNGSDGSSKTVNLYFYAKTITEAEINLVVDIVNRKLGEDM